jgi:AraC-like DNA-binding protein
LANAAGYSLWHAARMFKELTGKAPFEYIRSIRLSQAAVRLQEEQVKVIDVAFDFVFDSHEGFTRAFSKQFGLPPSQYRRQKPEVNLFIPLRIHDYYLLLQQGECAMDNQQTMNTVFVQVVDRPARKLIVKRGVKATHYFEYCEEVGCEIWDILAAIKGALYEPIGMWLPLDMIPPNTSKYAQGVEMSFDYAGPVPDGCDLVDLPPCKMMIFQGPPYEDEKFMDAIGNLWEVMKTYNPEIYGFQWADEDGPRFQLAPMGYRGYIEGRPVRVIK